jgi:hypothetical protein
LPLNDRRRVLVTLAGLGAGACTFDIEHRVSSRLLSPFEYPKPPGATPNLAIAFADIDLSVDRSVNGEDLGIRGDWFAVDSGSVGAIRVQLTLRDTRETQSHLCAPGRLIKAPFTNVRVFNDPVAPEIFNAPVATPVLLRALYGSGSYPVEDRAIHDAARTLAATLVVDNPTLGVRGFAITEGCVFDVHVQCSMAVAPGPEQLRSTITLNRLSGPASTINPDSELTDDVGAVNGTATLRATYRNLVIPRGIFQMRVNVTSLGFVFPSGGMSVAALLR